ncbi:MAG TPA: DUF58 domain-containing protein [Methylomirabilota bacterium]
MTQALWWPPRFIRPHRAIHPTREGWWCLLAAVGLGLTAVNSGNNLLYLLESMLLGLVIVSGILSEYSMRRLRLSPVLPEDVFAGRPAVVGARILNTKRRVPARSITLETVGTERTISVPRLAPGAERLVTWEHTFVARGRQRLPGVRVATRFPFGLFVKAGPVELDTEVLVFPAVTPVTGERPGPATGDGVSAARRRGRGSDLHNLREYRDGDDPRLIHWRVSAKTGATMVRELAADTTDDVCVLLRGRGLASPRLESGLSRAASLAVHFLRAGAAVSLTGPGVRVPPGRGREQARRVLTALALYAPAATPDTASVSGFDAEPAGRVVTVDLD